MRALQLLGKKLTISADDLALPALVAIGLRTAAFCVIIAILLFFMAYERPLDCDLRVGFLASFFILILVFVVVISMIYMAIFGTAVKGSLPEHEQRNQMRIFVYIVIFSYTLQLLVVGYGIVCLYYLFLSFSVVQEQSSIDNNEQVDEVCNGLKQGSFYAVLVVNIAAAADCGVFFAYCIALYCIRVSDSADDREIMVKRFEQRFKIGCSLASVVTCNLFGSANSPLGKAEEDAAMRKVAEVFSQFFHGTTLGHDMVLTDYAAIVLLLRSVQQSRYRAARRELYDLDRKSLKNNEKISSKKSSTAAGNNSRRASGLKRDMVNNFLWSTTSGTAAPPPPRKSDLGSGGMMMNNNKPQIGIRKNAFLMKVMKDASDFAPYMLAIYGEFVHLYMKPTQGVCDLVCSLQNPFRQGAETGDRLGLGEATLMKGTGIAKENILYASFTSYLGSAVPYAIIVDHANKKLLVTVRGTFSLQDMMTDAMLVPRELSKIGKLYGFNGQGHYAHSGWMDIALRMRDDIEKHQILHHLMRCPVPEHKRKFLDSSVSNMEGLLGQSNLGNLSTLPDCRNYDFVIVGHSMGAGIGCLLGLMLRGDFPSLRAFGYSPPGCVLSKEIADSTADWMTTVWFGMDMVPRLSWRTLLITRAQLLDCYRRAKVSKYRILASLVTEEEEDHLMYKDRQVPPDPIREAVYREIQILATPKENPSLMETIPMFMPGKLVHFDRRDREEIKYKRGLCSICCRLCCACCVSAPEKVLRYYPAFVSDRTSINSILISPRMLLDHFPDVAVNACREVYEFYENESRSNHIQEEGEEEELHEKRDIENPKF